MTFLSYFYDVSILEMTFRSHTALLTSQIFRKQEAWKTKAEEADLTKTIKSLRAQDRRSGTFIYTLAH